MLLRFQCVKGGNKFKNRHVEKISAGKYPTTVPRPRLTTVMYFVFTPDTIIVFAHSKLFFYDIV